MDTQGACSCNSVAFAVRAAPLFRVFCHCTICQRFNAAPFADVLVFRQNDIDTPAESDVSYSTYKPPPNVQRGRCRRCDQPAIERFTAPLLPKLTMVPASMFETPDALALPCAHLFYEKRLADYDDALARHHGFLRSQWGFLRYLRKGLRDARSTD